MWKPIRSLNALFAKLRARGRAEHEKLSRALLEPPSRDDVLAGFRLILGREITKESDISAQLRHRSVAEFRLSLLNSVEFQAKFRLIRPGWSEHPDVSRARDSLVFIHLQKTGGMSLRALLQTHFPADRICPMIDNNLHLLSVAELGRYDLFAGHFDRSCLSLIPRNRIRTVSLLRDPRARLVSFYRFHKAHPPIDEFADNVFVRFANELSAEQFFERHEIRSAAEVYNHYVIALGRSFAWFIQNQPSPAKNDLDRALADAKQFVDTLTGIGITEHFEKSIKLIYESLQLPPPSSVPPLNVTDKPTEWDARFRKVDPVTMTPRLAAALEDLTAYDCELYQYALREFWRRWAAFGAEPASAH